MNSLPFLLIFVALLLVGTALYVTSETGEVQEALSVQEQERFVRQVDTAITQISERNRGAEQEFSFALPDAIEKVCFVDWKSYDALASPELEIKKQQDKNVFFFPQGTGDVAQFSLSQSPLCVETKGAASLRVENLGTTTKLSAPGETAACQGLLLQNGSVNIVFLGTGYDDSFTEDALYYIEEVFETIPPFSSYKEKFNYYLVPEKVSCDIKGHIQCNNFALKKAASQCPHDFIIVLAERNDILDKAFPVRSSSIQNIVKVNTADTPLVLAHEFAHAFANLYDEYTEDAYYGKFGLSVEEMPNCDGVQCSSWEGVPGTACYKGCSLSSFYRSTDNSIMRYYFKEGGTIFGPVNTQLLTERLEAYS